MTGPSVHLLLDNLSFRVVLEILLIDLSPCGHIALICLEWIFCGAEQKKMENRNAILKSK